MKYFFLNNDNKINNLGNLRNENSTKQILELNEDINYTYTLSGCCMCFSCTVMLVITLIIILFTLNFATYRAVAQATQMETNGECIKKVNYL